MASDAIDVDASVMLLRALANPARLRIALRLLDGECAVAALETDLGIRQPNLSQHLGELRDAGLIIARRESRSVFYRLSDSAQRLAGALLHGFGGAAEPHAATGIDTRVRSSQTAMFATVGTPR